jgi:ABC-2 type transport system permease protein
MTPAFLALVRADLRLFFSNRRSLLVSVVAPIVIAAFFGALFGPGGGKPSRIPVAVTDLDRSALSERILVSMRADEALALTETGADEAQALLRAGKLRAAIVLPAGLAEQAPGGLFGAGRKPVIEIAYDPSQTTALPIVRGLLSQHVAQQVSSDVFGSSGTGLAPLRAQLKSGGLPEDLQRDLETMLGSVERVQRRLPAAPAGTTGTEGAAAASAGATVGRTGAGAPASGSAAAPAAGGLGLPFTTRETAVTGRVASSYNAYAHAFAGMGVQFVLLMGLDLGVALLALRRQGLWKRLRAAPLSKAVLLGSRVTSCALIAVVVLSIVYAVAMAAFGVRIEGSLAGFAAVMLAFGLLTASFGLLIAALGRTPEVTRGLAIVLTLLMVMIGGAWVPSFIFPEWLQQASLAMPTRWAIDGLEAMTWRGLGLDAAWPPVLALLGFSAVFAALAVWRFEWEE